MRAFEAVAARLEGGFGVAAPLDEAFPLFSPLGEKSWVPNWAPELLYPRGVSWTQGMIFRTANENGEAIWVVSRLDLDAHEVEYRRVEPGRYVVRVSVRCTADGAGGTSVGTEYEFVGLSDSGNAEIAAMTQDGYARKMQQWAAWIRQHLATRRG